MSQEFIDFMLSGWERPLFTLACAVVIVLGMLLAACAIDE